MAARVGLAPTPNGLTGRRATLTLPGNGAAGRIPTRMSPLRRRMPDVFGHGSNLKWSERQDFHLRPRGPKPRALKTELRSDELDSERLNRAPEWRMRRRKPWDTAARGDLKLADPKGLAPSAFPQTTGCSSD